MRVSSEPAHGDPQTAGTRGWGRGLLLLGAGFTGDEMCRSRTEAVVARHCPYTRLRESLTLRWVILRSVNVTCRKGSGPAELG